MPQVQLRPSAPQDTKSKRHSRELEDRRQRTPPKHQTSEYHNLCGINYSGCKRNRNRGKTVGRAGRTLWHATSRCCSTDSSCSLMSYHSSMNFDARQYSSRRGRVGESCGGRRA